MAASSCSNSRGRFYFKLLAAHGPDGCILRPSPVMLSGDPVIRPTPSELPNMKRFTIALVVLGFLVANLDAAPRRRGLIRKLLRPRATATASRGRSRTISGHGRSNRVNLTSSGQSIARDTAVLQALRNRCFHPGNSFGGASGSYEGVGAGPTREEAILNCCWKNSPIVGEHAARSRSGQWFACRRYQ